MEAFQRLPLPNCWLADFLRARPPSQGSQYVSRCVHIYVCVLVEADRIGDMMKRLNDDDGGIE